MARINDKKQRLVQAADHLILNNSFNMTTLALIAQEAQVPLGNVYYYFKTKEEILKAVLQIRYKQLEALFIEWQNLPTARERLLQFTYYFLNQDADMSKGGCALGSLSVELAKQNNPLAPEAARIMSFIIDWVSQQLKQTQHMSNGSEKARQLIAWIQGIAVLSCSLHDPELSKSQIAAIERWLAELT